MPQHSVKEAWSTVRQEFRESSLVDKALLGGAIAGLGFEWATGNEALLAYVGSQVLATTHNSLLAGTASGAAAFAEQSAVGTLMALNVNRFPNTMHGLQESLDKDTPETAESRKPSVLRTVGRYAARGWAVGSGLSILKDSALGPRTLKENLVESEKVGTATGVEVAAAVGGLATAALLAGQKLHIEPEVNFVINDVLANPLTYITAYSTVFIGKRLKLGQRAKTILTFGRRRRSEPSAEMAAPDTLADQPDAQLPSQADN